MASKYEYLKLAHRLGYTLKRWWVLRVFSQPVPSTTDHDSGKCVGYVYVDGDGKFLYVNESGLPEEITDAVLGYPLFGVKEKVTINAGDFDIADKKYDTFYSTLYTNLMLFEYPFGKTLPYYNGKFSGKYLDGLIATKLKAKDISVKQYREYTKALGFISCLTTVAVPAASKRALLPPPDITQRRDALLEKHKDHLDDPTVVAKIEKELSDYYREYIKGDISEGFFLSDKMYDVVLKRTHIMFGSEPRLDDPSKVDLAIPSLREGWDIKDLPMMANSLRMGSYNRGAATALGGEAAKFSSRIYQNTKLIAGDCGSIVGMPTVVNKYNVNSFNGRYMLEGGKLVAIKKSSMSKYLGKTIYLRSPQTCATLNGDFCEICMGDEVTEVGIGLGPQASAVGSVFLSQSLAAMHGTSLKLEPLDIMSSID